MLALYGRRRSGLRTQVIEPALILLQGKGARGANEQHDIHADRLCRVGLVADTPSQRYMIREGAVLDRLSKRL